MFGTVCMNVGSIAVAYDVFKKETAKEKQYTQPDGITERQNFY
jgi:hypothetical protein